MERIIFHVDVDFCYAQIELREHPEWRGRPLAVGGSKKDRHGIILAKCPLAKKAGVKTGHALFEARQLCPDLRIVQTKLDLYTQSTDRIREIYSDYTDLVESFGIDENWADVTGCTREGVKTAHELQSRIFAETGLTASIGVSWNKIFAKLGSDVNKPNGMFVITKENYKDTVWPMPVEDLLMVGRATKKKLNTYGIKTIGGLAKTDPMYLQTWLGKPGLALYAYANGLDNSPVKQQNTVDPEKSIGNSWTVPRDLVSDEDVWLTLLMICEGVGTRLRKSGYKGTVIEFSHRNTDLYWRSHQRKLKRGTDITKEILDISFALYKEARHLPFRSIGVRATGLIAANTPEQLDIFQNAAEREKMRAIDGVVDDIRDRFGFWAIQRGSKYLDDDLGKLNVLKHTVHPVGWGG